MDPSMLFYLLSVKCYLTNHSIFADEYLQSWKKCEEMLIVAKSMLEL